MAQRVLHRRWEGELVSEDALIWEASLLSHREDVSVSTVHNKRYRGMNFVDFDAAKDSS